MGWSEGDLGKHQILIEDCQGETHPGSLHLGELARHAAIGVFESGCRPANFHVTDICDGWAMGHSGMEYSLLSREVIADMVEIHASVIPWDGMVLISSCDKSIPAHLKAAARVNIPAIHVPGGSMAPGPGQGTTLRCGKQIGHSPKKRGLTDRMIRLTHGPGCGSCQFMGTASTMQILSESLGMALPSSALAPATFAHIDRKAREAGRMITELCELGIKPSDIMTYEAFQNAMVVHAAIGGSTNALLHLPAIAHELEIDLPLEDFDRINRRVPFIADVQPSGRYTTQLVWFAGGVPALQQRLRGFLNLDVLTVTGRHLRKNLAQFRAARWGFEDFLCDYSLSSSDIIRPINRPLGSGSIAILRGNLAPEGAVVKYSSVSREMMQHTGTVAVFNSEEEAVSAVKRGRIGRRSVIVIRYEGPKGSGMPEMLRITEMISLDEKLRKSLVLITDGRFSGGTQGPCIGHVSPEASDGGPIALVENDDIVDVNIPERSLNVVGVQGKRLRSNEVRRIFEERKKGWKPLTRKRAGVRKRFSEGAKPATSASLGAFVE